MRVTLARAALLADLRLAERVLPARSPEPALEGVLLRTTDTGCTLLAHDREVALWLDLPAQVERPGAVLLPARQTLALLRESSADTLHIGRAEDGAGLHADGLTCRLLSPFADCYPAPAPFP